ncbi:MAG: hypothetical protein USCAAHI_00142 [Beijerinckiaceae bacterium]|nr:MAG: hypothetical protein USCAAHI_00142 [Beijerinckiaceae bacterium]
MVAPGPVAGGQWPRPPGHPRSSLCIRARPKPWRKFDFLASALRGASALLVSSLLVASDAATLTAPRGLTFAAGQSCRLGVWKPLC